MASITNAEYVFLIIALREGKRSTIFAFFSYRQAQGYDSKKEKSNLIFLFPSEDD